MQVRTQVFHAPKKGNAESEYEDASFPNSALEREAVSEFRCAVADGASESAFADVWAQLLVRAFGRRRMRLERLRRLWQRSISGRPVPWYLEKKITRGAHAAFVGLSLRDGSANGHAEPQASSEFGDWLELPSDETPTTGVGSWRALAIGDSCLFHVRGPELLTVGPLDASEQFGNTPALLSSTSPKRIRRASADVTVLSGAWQPGDTFYLATDAIAQWLLSIQEAGRPPWVHLDELCVKGDTETFDRLVEELRAEGDLHNDDTTLLRVEVTS
jgi:hypothetical protein